MKPVYLSIQFDMGSHDHDIWLAMLGQWSFESFHDETDHVIGYIQDHDITGSLMQFIEANKGIFYNDFEMAQVPDRNWNEVWESSFNPVAVGDYCYIMAEFHKAPETAYRHHVTISPKMAFGTGHHATTYMMLQAMSFISFSEKKVLDFGCGTGILAIVAAFEGAQKIDGVDIQPEAVENSIEHATLNGVAEKCAFYLGGLEKASNGPYDIILANINRNIIIQHLPDLKNLLTSDGYLLISGIMFDDVEIIKSSLQTQGLTVIAQQEKDQWVQMTIHSPEGPLPDNPTR